MSEISGSVLFQQWEGWSDYWTVHVTSRRKSIMEVVRWRNTCMLSDISLFGK